MGCLGFGCDLEGKLECGQVAGVFSGQAGGDVRRGAYLAGLLPMAAIKTANLEYDPRADLKRDKLQRKQRHGNDRKRGN